MARTPEQQAVYNDRPKTVADEFRNLSLGAGQDIDDLIGGAKQTGAGFVSMLSNSPAAMEDLGEFGRFIPNAVWGIAALPATIKAGLQVATGNEVKLDSVLDKPLSYLQSGINQTNENVNVPYPTNTLGMIARGGGELLSAPAAIVPKALSKGATLGMRTLGAAITPGMQSRTVTGAVTELGLYTALGDTASEFLDPEYQSALWTKDNVAKVQEMEGNNADRLTPSRIFKQIQVIKDTPGAEARVDINNMRQTVDGNKMFHIFEEDTDAMEGKLVSPDDEGFGYKKLAGLAAALGIGATVAGRRQIARSNIKQTAAMSELTSAPDYARTSTKKVRDAKDAKMITSSFTPDSAAFDGTDLAKAQLLDNTHLPKKLIQAQMDAGIIGQKEGQDLLNMTTLKLDVKSVTSRVKEFMQSGFHASDKANGGRRVTPMTHILGRQNSLSNSEKASLADMRILGTKLDQITAANKAAKKKKKPANAIWGDQTDPNAITYNEAQIRQEYKGMMDAFPQLKARLLAEQQYYREFNGALFDAGQLTAKEFKQRMANPRYAPTRLADVENSSTAFGAKRTALDDLNTILPGESVDPITLMPEYTTRNIVKIQQEPARFKLIQNAADNPVILPNGKPLVEVYKGKMNPQNMKPDMIKAKGANGETVYYTVRDKYLRNSFMENPSWGEDTYSLFWRLAQKTAHVKKSVTTGIASTFAPTSALYDVVASSFANDPKLSMTMMRTQAGGLANADPTILLNPVTGTINNAHSKLTASIAQRMDAAIYSNSRMKALIPDDATLASLSNRMQQSYLRSQTRYYERFGGGASPLLDSSTDPAPDILSQIIPSYVRKASPKAKLAANSVVNGWRAWNDSLHGSNRTAIFGHNLPVETEMVGTMSYFLPDGKKMTFPHIGRKVEDGFDFENLSRQVLEAGVNPNKMGGIPGTPAGIAYRKYLKSALYANISIQSAARLGRAALDDPLGVASALAAYTMGTTAYISTAILGNPQALATYLSLSERQRSQSIPIIDDDGEIVTTIAIPPELRPYMAAVIEGQLMLSGATEIGDKPAQKLMRESWNAVASDVAFTPIPQIMKTGLAATVPFISDRSEIGQYISAPTYYATGMNPDTLEDDARQAINGVSNELIGAWGSEFIGAISSFAATSGLGDDIMSRADDALTFVGASKNTKGTAIPMLFRTEDQVDKSITSNNLDNSWTYETDSKITDWMKRYKSITEKGDITGTGLGTVSPQTNAPFAPMADPMKEGIIAKFLSGAESRMLGQGYNSDLAKLADERKRIKYGGSVYTTAQSQRNALNIAVEEQNKVLARKRGDLKIIENGIANALAEAGYETDWTFDSMSRYPTPEGNSVTTPSLRRTDLEPFLPK